VRGRLTRMMHRILPGLLVLALPGLLAAQEDEPEPTPRPPVFFAVRLLYGGAPEPARAAAIRALAVEPARHLAVSESLEDPDVDPVVEITAGPIGEDEGLDEGIVRLLGHGLDDAQVATAIAAGSRVDLVFAAHGEAAVALLRAASDLVHDAARKTGALIVDFSTLETFTPDAWKEVRVEGWHGGLPAVHLQGSLHVYPDGEWMRAVTYGMDKLGLPDIVLERFPRGARGEVEQLVVLTAQTLLENEAALEGGVLTLDIASIRHAGVRERLRRSCVGEPAGRARVACELLEPGEEDPENVILRFDFGEGAHEQELQARVFQQLFGYEAEFLEARHDEAIEAASEKARDRCIEVYKPRVAAGLAPGERLAVKAPFRTRDDGTEWIWVEVVSWQDGRIRGVLMNEPVAVPDLKLGSQVAVAEIEIFDYLFVDAEGNTDGNTTEELLKAKTAR